MGTRPRCLLFRRQRGDGSPPLLQRRLTRLKVCLDVHRFVERRLRGFDGPFARRSASNSDARSSVIVSGVSAPRIVALTSPSVTYGPKRPSFTTTGFCVS